MPNTYYKLPFEEVHKICFEYTEIGLKTMSEVAAKRFRFMYVSGSNAERDERKEPWLLGKYVLLRVSNPFPCHINEIRMFPSLKLTWNRARQRLTSLSMRRIPKVQLRLA